jgi:hypothetical protein
MTLGQVSLLSEKQLNIEIAKLLKPKNLVFDDDGFPMVKNPNIEEYFYLNYRSDWDRLMPIVDDLGISLLNYKGCGDPTIAQFQTFEPPHLIETSNINSQRSLAECCLLVLQHHERA